MVFSLTSAVSQTKKPDKIAGLKLVTATKGGREFKGS